MSDKKIHFIYGLHAVESAIKNDASNILGVSYASGRSDKRLNSLLALIKSENIPIESLERVELDKLVNSTKHQGIVAKYQRDKKQFGESDLTELLNTVTEPALLLVLDGITDPHNLGACLRSAEAAGVHGVIIPKDKAADITPIVYKVSAGAAERLPVFRVTNLSRTLDKLKQAGVWITGTDGETDQVIFQANLTGPTALVMGSEGKGMRRLTKEACDQLIKIPMSGQMESLNVSVATGVCLFEIVRQRQNLLK